MIISTVFIVLVIKVGKVKNVIKILMNVIQIPASTARNVSMARENMNVFVLRERPARTVEIRSMNA